MAALYIVDAKTSGGGTSIGTRDPTDALRCAREFLRTGRSVSITDQSGTTYTVQSFEAMVGRAASHRPGS